MGVGGESGKGDGERTLESDLVALERVHRLLEEGGILGRVSRDVEALKLNGDVDVL